MYHREGAFVRRSIERDIVMEARQESCERKLSPGAYGVLFFSLLLIAALIRSLYLTHFPMQIHNDEASTVSRGFRLIKEWTLSGILSGAGFSGHPSFGFWLASIPSQLLGIESVWTLRLSSAIIGTVSLLSFACFVARGFGRRIALLFLLFATPFHLHVHYSRTGFIYIHAVLFAGLVSWAFAAFVTRTSFRAAFLTGLTMGFGMLVYPATQVLPIAMVAALVLGVLPPTAKVSVLWKHPKLLVGVIGSVVVGGLVSFGPQLSHIYHHGYLSRLGSTFILQPHNIRHLSGMMRDPSASHAEILWFNILQTLKFFYRSDSGEQYNFVQSPIPWWFAPFAIVGLGMIVTRSCRREALSLTVS